MSRLNPFGKVFSREELSELCTSWKHTGEKVVFTNGVFDIIHPGHVIYLKEAAELGTRLIIGVNSDASARLLNKGVHRPINDQDARALVISSLTMVSAVVIFDEPTPLQLIKTLLPGVLVKGGDYKESQVVGADEVIANGGEVKIIRFVDGYSTTNIEQKILKSAKGQE